MILRQRKTELIKRTIFAFVATCLLFCTGVIVAQDDPVNADSGEVIDIVGPQPVAPGDYASFRALVRNTGSFPWSAGTKIRYRLKFHKKTVWQHTENATGTPAGEQRWVELLAQVPAKLEDGIYRFRADIVNGDVQIAHSPKAVPVYLDPFAFYDGFERSKADQGGWGFKRAEGDNRIRTTKTMPYSGSRGLELTLNGGGTSYLEYEYHESAPDRITISMRLRFDQAAMDSGGPINFFTIFGADQYTSAYFYYYLEKKWFQLAYLKPGGEWEHCCIAYSTLAPDTWYHLRATVVLGSEGRFVLALDGVEIMRRKAVLDYGIISNLAVGHYPSDTRLRGTVNIDDVRWARKGVDAIGLGRVSITFDDGAISQWINARPLLDKYGYKASFYIITENSSDPIDSQTGGIYAMDRNQLLALQQQGHVIGSHSHTHKHMTKLSAEEIEQELSISRTTLASWGLQVNSFSLPYGDFNDDVLTRVAKSYQFCLTTQEGINPFDAFKSKRNLLRVDPATKSFKELRRLIDETERTGGWLVLYYHSIGPGHSGDAYWVSSNTFGRTLKYLSEKNIKVIPIELAP